MSPARSSFLGLARAATGAFALSVIGCAGPPAPVRASVVVVTASEGRPAEPPSLRTEVKAPETRALVAPCRIESVGGLDTAMLLSVEGRSFATFDVSIKAATIVLDERGGHAWLRTSGLAVEGDVDLTRLRFRAKKALTHDGWLEVSRFRVGAATHSSDPSMVQPIVGLPNWIVPQKPLAPLPCTDVEPVAHPDVTFVSDDTPQPPQRHAVLVRGTNIELRRAPRGEVVATFALPSPREMPRHGLRGRSASDHDVWVRVLERRAGWVEVRYETDDFTLHGWVEERLTKKPLPSHADGEPTVTYGLMGLGSIPARPSTMTCRNAVPLRVALPSSAPIVGGTVAGRELTVERCDETRCFVRGYDWLHAGPAFSPLEAGLFFERKACER